MMIHNRNILVPVVLTIVFCAMVLVVSAQKAQNTPSAVLLHEQCRKCTRYDTLCQFQYGDIVLTEDSITFKDMGCIYQAYESGYRFFTGTYLVFSFPNGKKHTMELFNYVSSYVPQYAPIIYRRGWGNTLPIHAKFGKDWSKSLKKFVKKWNSYN
jgi:hypothetical protein